MLTRVLLIALLLLFLARALWRLLGGIVAGASRPGSSQTPQRSQPMVRDPVCGTFVLPARAVSLQRQDGSLYFCSERCRAEYQRAR